MLERLKTDNVERVANLKNDVLASVVVFLVALPLCMGIAIASGVPPASGLITGIIGGLVVGMFSGSPLQVSGPAAGLAVIVAQLIQQHGKDDLMAGLKAMGVVVLLAGLLQFIAGLFRMGQWFRAVSPAVVQGMLAGIGVLILASQFHVMVDDVPAGHGLTNLATIPISAWKALVPIDSSPHHKAAFVGVLTIATIIFWQTAAPRRLRFVPAPLAAVVIATAVAAWIQLDVLRIQVPNNLIQAAVWIDSDALMLVSDGSIWASAVLVAVIASAETLLCATAVDQLHSGPRTRYDQELAAQGIGNVLCGIAGALPMTGVIVRSSANVQAGAKSRLSAILHGAWLLLFVAAFPALLTYIPKACLGALLVYTGYKLVDIKAIRRLANYSWTEVGIYLATVVTIVVQDLLVGVLVGVLLSAAKLLYRFSHLNIRFERDPDSNRGVLYLEGAATFVRLPVLARALERVPANTELHVHFEQLDYIDHACLELLIGWGKQHLATGGNLVIDWESLHARFSGPDDNSTADKGDSTPSSPVSRVPVR